MKLKHRILILFVFSLIISCSSESKRINLDDTFYKGWMNSTHSSIDSQKEKNIECFNVLEKRINWIGSFNFRNKALDTIISQLENSKHKNLIIEENFFNHGISYSLSLYLDNTKYYVKLEGEHIVTNTIKKNENKICFLKCEGNNIICNDQFINSQELASISIISHFEKNKNKIELQQICID